MSDKVPKLQINSCIFIKIHLNKFYEILIFDPNSFRSVCLKSIIFENGSFTQFGNAGTMPDAVKSHKYWQKTIKIEKTAGCITANGGQSGIVLLPNWSCLFLLESCRWSPAREYFNVWLDCVVHPRMERLLWGENRSSDSSQESHASLISLCLVLKRSNGFLMRRPYEIWWNFCIHTKLIDRTC